MVAQHFVGNYKADNYKQEDMLLNFKNLGCHIVHNQIVHFQHNLGERRKDTQCKR